MPAQKNTQKPEESGESSTSAAKQAVAAVSNGVVTYELPWYDTHRVACLTNMDD